jgi:hypothetical protein
MRKKQDNVRDDCARLARVTEIGERHAQPSNMLVEEKVFIGYSSFGKAFGELSQKDLHVTVRAVMSLFKY